MRLLQGLHSLLRCQRLDQSTLPAMLVRLVPWTASRSMGIPLSLARQGIRDLGLPRALLHFMLSSLLVPLP